jgi:hypothetical protein
MHESFSTSKIDSRHIFTGDGDAPAVARDVLGRFEDRTLLEPTLTG